MHTQKPLNGILDLKQQGKLALQESFGWPQEPRRPIVILPAGMSDKLGGDLFHELLPGLLTLPIELLVVGRGSAEFGALFTKLNKDHKHKIHIVADKDEPLKAMYTAADMALFLSDPKGMKELQLCLSAGIVPISLPCSALDDYDPVQESGNAFLYGSENAWQCFASLVRAIETYKLPFDWRTIQKHGMETAKEFS